MPLPMSMSITQKRERLALRAQRIRAAGIAAAERADVHAAAQPPDDETADERAEQIAREYLEDELGHEGKNISASMQRTLPPLESLDGGDRRGQHAHPCRR